MANNAIIRKRVDELQAQAKVDREWWDKRRASIKTDFMKELDEGTPATPAPITSGPVSRPTTSGGEKVNSDDDTVLVEGGGPGVTGSAAGSKGGTKRRKGKK